LLASALIGRVIVSVDALPAAFPVSYRVVEDAIVFRTAPGTKLTAAVNHTVVGFEVDEIDVPSQSGWSVLVVGTSQVVTDEAEVAVLDTMGIASWLTAEDASFVRVRLQRVSGRRLNSQAL
jgi:nitroimidazol reductase NimA-like FMN-containing flavoprotein (pyridoxamine 5'-phosphate oxidase superfamily)